MITNLMTCQTVVHVNGYEDLTETNCRKLSHRTEIYNGIQKAASACTLLYLLQRTTSVTSALGDSVPGVSCTDIERAAGSNFTPVENHL